MRYIALVAALVSVVSCSKKDEGEASSPADSPAESGEQQPAADPQPEPPADPEPAGPPVEPVNLTAEQLNPTCAKIFPAEVADQLWSASEVRQEAQAPGMVVCQMFKGEEMVGGVTMGCKPDLDPTAIERERAVMTKATDLPPSIGRGGYRIANSFVFIDDETPCRLMVSFSSPPADDALAGHLRAITKAVAPSTLE